jgi:DNA repair ATPase RecN
MTYKSDEYARQLYNAVVEYMDSLANPHNFERLNEAILHLNEQSAETGFPDVGRELKLLAFQISEARGQIVMLIAQYDDNELDLGIAEDPLPEASKKLLREIVDIANCIAAMLLELSEMCEENESSREICSYVILVNEVIVEAITHLRNERAAIASLLETLLHSAAGSNGSIDTDHSPYCVDKTGRIIRQSGD